MKRLGMALAVGVAAAALNGCATMNANQCLAGDWGGQGFNDGAEGRPLSRLDNHAKACAKHGMVPLEAPYRSARADGLTLYCTRERGFEEGRGGDAYHQVCPVDLEADFLPAYRDGQRLHAVEAALALVESDFDSALARIEDREDKLEAKQRELRQEGLTDAERERIRDRIQEVRGELRDAHQAARRAESEIGWARDAVDRVRAELSGKYPV